MKKKRHSPSGNRFRTVTATIRRVTGANHIHLYTDGTHYTIYRPYLPDGMLKSADRDLVEQLCLGQTLRLTVCAYYTPDGTDKRLKHYVAKIEKKREKIA